MNLIRNNPTNESLMERDVRNRCAESKALLEELQRRFAEGDSSEELLLRLESLWKDPPSVETLPTNVRELLAEVQKGIASAVDEASTWMTQSAEELDQLARGRRLIRQSHAG